MREPGRLPAGLRHRGILRVLLVVLFLAATAWGLWCWFLASEYIIDFRGEEMQVGLGTVVGALGLWAIIILGMVTTWRALNGRGLGQPTERRTD